MTPQRRLLLIALTIAALLLGVVAWATLDRDEGAPPAGVLPGHADAVAACRDVDAAARVLDGAHAALAPTVLDHAVLMSVRAAAADEAWSALDAAVAAFHDATHGTDPDTVARTRAEALTACEGLLPD